MEARTSRNSRQMKIYSDHKALEYFTTTENLTGRQARWAEAVSEYYFLIMYRLGHQNAKANALIRRDQDLEAQNGVKNEYRAKAFLSQDQIDPQVLSDLVINADHMLEPIEEGQLEESLGLIDRILPHNREASSLQALRTEGRRGNGDLTLEDGLLLYDSRLGVPDADNVHTELIKEAHDQVFTAHPGRDKTYHIRRAKYYWRGMGEDIERYIRNCHPCRRADVPRDKSPGFLHPLSIPDHPWQRATRALQAHNHASGGGSSIFPSKDFCWGAFNSGANKSKQQAHHGSPE